jgi:rhodanese-related sulfurtransferase
MKTLTILIALVATPAFAGAEPPQTPAAQAAKASAKKLSRAEFDALLSTPDRVLLLDVRRPDEVQSIGGFAAYLSIQADQLEKQLPFIPKDRLIVPISNHAARAGRAAAMLEQHGFKVAGVIGVQDYEAEGGTVVKIAPPAPKAGGR